MKQIYIDVQNLDAPKQLHELLSRELSFPDWYRPNLDALHDCLTEVFDNTQLILRNWCFLEENLGAYAAAIRRAMTHAEKENPCIEIYFD